LNTKEKKTIKQRKNNKEEKEIMLTLTKFDAWRPKPNLFKNN